MVWLGWELEGFEVDRGLVDLALVQCCLGRVEDFDVLVRLPMRDVLALLDVLYVHEQLRRLLSVV